MNIGVVTHCEAINFGANLQALSTAYYLLNNGHTPIFLNWNEYVNETINHYKILAEQYDMHINFLRDHGFKITKPCSKNEDFIREIENNDIHLILVGSDAVLTVASFLDKILITKKGLKIKRVSINYKFPNPFWIPYYNKLKDVSVKFLSPSCQSTRWNLLKLSEKKEMKACLNNFTCINARDSYTARMMHNLLKQDVAITPDPVFGFNQNVREILVEEKQDFYSRMNIRRDYVCISFYGIPNENWLLTLKKEINDRNMDMLVIPMPQGSNIEVYDIKISLPLNSLDWYKLIKYSNGYIGHNMHPIIVSIHNSVPFFSIDQHGKNLVGRFDKSSKVYDLLSRTGLLEYRVSVRDYKKLNPSIIMNRLENFDKRKCKEISDNLLEKYNNLMSSLIGE